jgi:hypothetical protein
LHECLGQDKHHVQKVLEKMEVNVSTAEKETFVTNVFWVNRI